VEAEMKKLGVSLSLRIGLAMGFVSLCVLAGCKRAAPPKPADTQAQVVASEIDTQDITARTGVRFRIIKTEVRGYMPIHKFFWVCVSDQTPGEKVEGLVREIINATIVKYPKTYHSFTVHLFHENELTGKPEDCWSFAQATFLPEGDWTKVGRIPIDGYKNYQLNLNYSSREKPRK
jgi:hypothetical protein